MSIHLVGVLGLVLVFLVAAVRPISLGVAALVMTFLVGTIFAGESAAQMYAGFPVDLFVLLVGVTYLFAIASANGTVERVVEGAARLVRDRRAVPWIVFVATALPTMAGALGSASVALLAPFSLRLAQRYRLDRRMIGLMVVHGAACGNFSPLNVLGAIVHQAIARNGLEVSGPALFLGNVAYNVALAAVACAWFGGLRREAGEGPEPPRDEDPRPPRLRADQVGTLLAILAVAIAPFAFGLGIGFVAFAGAAALCLAFPSSCAGAEKKIAWDVVLLVCGVVTYVAALQRHGTVDAVGTGLAGLGTPLVTALLLCAVGAVTSAFASSAGILGALIPLAVPFLLGGEVGAVGLIIALAISSSVVDSSPFSTSGALVVANSAEDVRDRVFRGLMIWGLSMIIIAPVLSWAIFVVPGWL